MSDKKESKVPTNEILEKCKKESVKIADYRSKHRDSMNCDLYKKIKKEIQDGERIKYKIADRMSRDKISFHYFINRWSMDYRTMHCCYDLIDDDDSQMDCLTAMDIFETTKYGSTILVDILKEKFPPPFKILTTYLPIQDEYCVLIHWSAKKDSHCVIL